VEVPTVRLPIGDGNICLEEGVLGVVALPYHGPKPVDTERAIFLEEVVLGFELGALHLLGRHSTA
jgi:hypothetical protein